VTQLALIDSDRVYESERAAWDVTEAYYSLPVYIWPLFEYLRRLALERDEYRHIARHRRALVRKWAREVFAPTGVFVEPCAGAGALVDGWCQYVLHGLGNPVEPGQIVTGDVRELPTDWRGDWCEEWPQSWTFNRPSVLEQMGWHPIGKRNARPFSLVATNPPFTLAKAIVEASWHHCLGITAILQRSGWYEPTEDRGRWLQAHNPDEIVIGRCNFTRPDGGRVGGGNNPDSCSWYVTGPDKKGLLLGHHEIIGWRDAPRRVGGVA
jgi:hypothetical protein